MKVILVKFTATFINRIVVLQREESSFYIHLLPTILWQTELGQISTQTQFSYNLQHVSKIRELNDANLSAQARNTFIFLLKHRKSVGVAAGLYEIFTQVCAAAASLVSEISRMTIQGTTRFRLPIGKVGRCKHNICKEH